MARRILAGRSRVPATPGAQAGWLLGAAGLLPFFAAGAAIWAGYGRIGFWALAAVQALLTYGATIVSFLGGVRWGFELQQPGGPAARNLFGSVLPQIGAWTLLFLPIPLPAAWGGASAVLAVRFGGVLLLLLVQGVADALSRDFPEWYRTLRIPLTAGAAAAMLAGLVWALHVRHAV